ncbi:hypothetical protein [Actinoplanes sp. NPDC051851]|uniref:hypothetical protein n=1 Tax=Actinoplanes sp. NPDC051851 TaxID=3154753 RepID=UPI0034488497
MNLDPRTKARNVGILIFTATALTCAAGKTVVDLWDSAPSLSAGFAVLWLILMAALGWALILMLRAYRNR